MKTIKINKNDANNRLDNFLSKTFINLKKPLIYKAIRNKQIKINNKKSKFNYKLNENDIVNIYLPDYLLENNHMEIKHFSKYNFEIIYEDKNILVVFKEPGLIVHKDNNNEQNTLINQVIDYLIKSNQYNPNTENSFIPSLLNRIDRNTTGLVLIAKNHLAQQILNEKIKNREVQKFYLTKVYGKFPKQSTIEKAYLTKNSNKNIVNISKKIINERSKEIVTGIKLLNYQNNISLLEIELFTGRTHQIRAHLNYLGFPIIGEQKYTKPQYSHNSKIKHQILIAYKLKFVWNIPSGILDYLNNKTIEINKKLLDKYLN